VALVTVEGLTFSYPGAEPALRDVSLQIEPGETIALLGPSGSGKSTLLRALAGLVPHFHGGRFAGRVEVAGLDTRRTRPAELAGAVASVFQDSEDQVVMAIVQNEVAFGLENTGIAPTEIDPRIADALEQVGISHLAERRTVELSGGELQRVCLASALALEPRLLLLDEPTSQLDPDGADVFLGAVAAARCAVVLSEHRVERALRLADRVVFLEGGRVLLDTPVAAASCWLAAHRPHYLATQAAQVPDDHAVVTTAAIVALDDVAYCYGPSRPVFEHTSLAVHAGEIVVLDGPNGSGKTTLAKLAAGLFEPTAGSIRRSGTATYLSQDPGRYLVKETAVDEVALAVGGDRERARVALERFGLGFAALRHPRDLSSGERERLGLAAVSVSEPDLLVLDEPTRGVDPDRKAAIGEWLVEEAAAGRAVLVATHDRTLPAHRRVTLGAGVSRVA
jgi:energy-coupling factor transport system ATP-binding protein